ncbi:MAG: hypothetical protein WAX07_04555 [Candidatus Altiarchaeia archaeon]
MASAKKLGLSVLAVLSVLLVGSLAWAVADTASGNKTRERSGNMTGMRGGGFGGGPGGMHGMLNATDLNLAGNATGAEIRAAMEEKRTAMEAKMNEERALVEAALSSGDYDAWKTAVGKTPRGTQLTSLVTEENFAKYAEMEGYMVKARALATELGLEGNGTDKGFGREMGGRGCPGGKFPEDATSEEATE